MSNVRRPLDDITVLDLTHALSGPICTSMLADYGARVIKVEGLKDNKIRGFDDDGTPPGKKAGDIFNSFTAINRNKDSICLNLRDPECMAILKKLIGKADVLISNYRPGTTKVMGIDYESLSPLYPRLICCEISAFREKGRENEPGYDVVVQAASGLIASTGYPGQPPAKPGPSLADIASGMTMMQGILLALIERSKTGAGQAVKVRMQDAAMFMMAQYAPSLIDDPEYEFKPNGMAHIEATPSNGFKTSDGYIFTAPAGDKLFPIFCDVIGMPHLLDDPRFSTTQNLIDNRDTLYNDVLGPMFLTKTTKEWYDLLSSAGLPVSPIATPKQAWLRAAEQHSPIVASVHHPHYGKMHTAGVALELSSTPGRVEKPAPYLGQNTYEVLTQMAGISPERISELEGRGVIRCCRPDLIKGGVAGER